MRALHVSAGNSSIIHQKALQTAELWRYFDGLPRYEAVLSASVFFIKEAHMAGIFEKMCSDEYKASYSNKIREKVDLPDALKESIITYINSDELDKDVDKLKKHEWFLDPPRQAMIRKGHSNRRRIVYCWKEKENYLLKYMTFILQDFDHLHCDSLCSFRTENRTNLFFKNVKEIDPNRELYIAKADFHDFGGSVDQDILLDIIHPYFEDDPDFFAFASWLMTRNEYYRNGKLEHKRVSIIEGLPIGNFFLNLYLRDMDFILEEQAVLYMRYTDDVAFFTDSYESAEHAINIVRDFADRLKLTVNEEKTMIIKPHEEAELLGIQIFEGGFDIGDFAIQKLTDKMKRHCDRQLKRMSWGKCTKQQAVRDMVYYYDRTFFGRKVNDHELNWVVHAFPIITRLDGLKKLDAIAQDCIRICGTGRKTNAKYRITYEDMVKLGYRNLVHAYYHGYEMKE